MWRNAPDTVSIRPLPFEGPSLKIPAFSATVVEAALCWTCIMLCAEAPGDDEFNGAVQEVALSIDRPTTGAPSCR